MKFLGGFCLILGEILDILVEWLLGCFEGLDFMMQGGYFLYCGGLLLLGFGVKLLDWRNNTFVRFVQLINLCIDSIPLHLNPPILPQTPLFPLDPLPQFPNIPQIPLLQLIPHSHNPFIPLPQSSHLLTKIFPLIHKHMLNLITSSNN